MTVIDDETSAGRWFRNRTASVAHTRYDAFGRAIETLGLDGKVRSRTKHHALSVDRWDAEDIGPGPHQGTYATEHGDGFGRVVRTTVRVRVRESG